MSVHQFDADFQSMLRDLPDEWGHACVDCVRGSGFTGCPTCPRLYLYTHRLRWFPKQGPKDWAITGNLVHRLFAGMYTGQAYKDVVGIVAGAVSATLESVTEASTRQIIVKSWNLARAMVDQWMKSYGHPLASNKVRPVAIERTIQKLVDTDAGPITIVGTIDLAYADDDRGGQVYLTDHKTCSERPSIRVQGLAFDSQTRIYRDLWDSAYPQQRAAGMVHNVMMKPGIRITKNETYEQYLERMGVWYETEQAGDPGMVPMLRSTTHFNEPPLMEHPEIIAQLTEAARWANKPISLSGFWRNRHACQYRGGMCPYMELCDSNLAVWPTRIVESGGFTKRTDPLNEALQGHSSLTEGVLDE